MISCTEIDGDLHVLEGKVAFIAMAANAIGMLNEGDYQVVASKKAWEGLGWYTEEIGRELREINMKINGESS